MYWAWDSFYHRLYTFCLATQLISRFLTFPAKLKRNYQLFDCTETMICEEKVKLKYTAEEEKNSKKSSTWFSLDYFIDRNRNMGTLGTTQGLFTLIYKKPSKITTGKSFTTWFYTLWMGKLVQSSTYLILHTLTWGLETAYLKMIGIG